MTNLVDVFPLRWDREEMQQLRTLLAAAYPTRAEADAIVAYVGDIDRAQIQAEGSGFDRWTSILEVAARAGRLRALVERVLNDSSAGGIHRSLRVFLELRLDGSGGVDAPSKLPMTPEEALRKLVEFVTSAFSPDEIGRVLRWSLPKVHEEVNFDKGRARVADAVVVAVASQKEFAKFFTLVEKERPRRLDEISPLRRALVG